MSHKSFSDWLKEHYPETAKEAAETSRARNDNGLYAARHSLKKWEGVCKKELDKYGMYVLGTAVWNKHGDNLIIDFSSENCSLCKYTVRGNYCFYCPGKEANGYTCLDAFVSMANKSSPRKMLIWLRKTVKYLESKQTK